MVKPQLSVIMAFLMAKHTFNTSFDRGKVRYATLNIKSWGNTIRQLNKSANITLANITDVFFSRILLFLLSTCNTMRFALAPIVNRIEMIIPLKILTAREGSFPALEPSFDNY